MLPPEDQVVQDCLREAGLAASEEAILWLKYPESVRLLLTHGTDFAIYNDCCSVCEKMGANYGRPMTFALLHERKCAWVEALHLLKRPELAGVVDAAHLAALEELDDIDRLRRPREHWVDHTIEQQEGGPRDADD